MRVTKPGALLLLTLFAVIALGGISEPQEERRIYGTVTNEAGTPLPNVDVILEYAPFGVIREQRWTQMSRTTTSASGEYRFSATSGSVAKALPEGLYRITFKYPGFGQVSRTTQIGLYVSGPDGVPKLVQEVNVQLPRNRSSDGTKKYARRARPYPDYEPHGYPPHAPDYRPSPIDPSRSEGLPETTPTPAPRPSPDATATPRPKSSNANVAANTNASANANTGPGPAPDSNLFEIDRIKNSLGIANIAFNTPESMSLNEAKKVELLLSTSLSQEDLQKAVEKHNVEGIIHGEEIKISDQMEAILTGDGFQITEVLPARRAISKTSVTEWTWDVRALKTGKLRLHLTLNAVVIIGGNPQPYPITTYDKEYIVSVGTIDTVVIFTREHWQWLWTTIFLPVGAWLWKRKRKPAETDAL